MKLLSLLLGISCLFLFEYSSAATCKVNDSDIAAEYSGDCKNGLANGQGVAKGKDEYKGEFLNGNKHGKGTYNWAKGDRYEGEWKDGKKHGKGTYISANGGRYDGEWRDDKRHGKGTLVTPDGGRYEGEWRDDKRHKGVSVYGSGSFKVDRYEGEYRDDKRNGKGTYISAKGDRYEGEWRDGKLHGKGTQVWSSGDRYEGEFQNGDPHGKGTLVRADGTRSDGEFRNGKRVDPLHAKHGISAYTKPSEFTNPFPLKGNKIAVHMRLIKMKSESEGLFTNVQDMDEPQAFISKIPSTMQTGYHNIVVKVLGLKQNAFGSESLPHLEFIEAVKEK